MNILEVAVEAATRAGRVLKDNIGRARSVEYKGAVDIVTDMDRAAESIIVDLIESVYPDHGILAEEREETLGSSDNRWIIDPLDGTTNYAHGFPVFCTSIAYETKGEVVLGIVYNPMLEEMFVAEKGTGAFLNGVRIEVSKVSEIGGSLLATGFPYDIRNTKKTNLEHFSDFALRAQAIRRAGSAALDLCYVATGRFDGFWELKLKPWDVAAAALIVKEAGGKITDFKDNVFSIYNDEFLASNGLIHGDMVKILQGQV